MSLIFPDMMSTRYELTGQIISENSTSRGSKPANAIGSKRQLPNVKSSRSSEPNCCELVRL